MAECALASLGGCSRGLDLHHILSKNKLKREFPYGFWLDTKKPVRRGEFLEPNRPFRSLHELLTAKSNLVVVCRFHHSQLENRRLYLEPPESAWEFAREVGLENVLLRQQERRAA